MTDGAEAMDPRYPLVVVDVSEDEADATSGELFELGAVGLEERDATTLVVGAAGRVTLVASFETHEDARAARDALGRGARVEELVGDAWRDEWKKHFHRFDLVPGLAIVPPWEIEQEDGKTGRIGLESPKSFPSSRLPVKFLILEPGRAFGTGLHETTSLVARALHDHRAELQGKAMLDAGCGSGILALVALALGAGRARAVDVDPESVLVTRENAERNGVGDARLEVDATPVAAIGATYPVVVANIDASVLVPIAPALAARVAASGLLILSGILATQSDAVRAAYRSLDLLETRAKGEWAALVLRRR